MTSVVKKVSRVRSDDIPTAEEHMQKLLRLIKNSPEKVDVYDVVDRVSSNMQAFPDVDFLLTMFSSNSTW